MLLVVLTGRLFTISQGASLKPAGADVSGLVNGAGGDTEGIDPTWVPEFLAPFRAFHASGLRTGLATVDLNLTHLVWRFQYTGRGAWPHSRPFDAATTVDELVLSRDLIRD